MDSLHYDFDSFDGKITYETFSCKYFVRAKFELPLMDKLLLRMRMKK